MKPIPFTLDAFGPDGMLKEGYVIRNPNQGTGIFAYRGERGIAVVYKHGYAATYGLNNPRHLELYMKAGMDEIRGGGE